MHYLLFYETADDYAARRPEFRDAHLEKAWKASARGELVLAGALANPLDGAVLLFQGDSPEVAENFAKVDPYVTNGLVKRWYVREWTTVVGEKSATPVRPSSSSAREELRCKPAGTMARRESCVARMWKGASTPENAAKYSQHLIEKVFPELRAIEGYRGLCLLRRNSADGVEFVVVTFWDSMEAVRRFAGPEQQRAVVAQEARAVLASFDDFVTHFEVDYFAGELEK